MNWFLILFLIGVLSLVVATLWELLESLIIKKQTLNEEKAIAEWLEKRQTINEAYLVARAELLRFIKR